MHIPPSDINTGPISQRTFRQEWGDAIAEKINWLVLGIPFLNYRDDVYWVIDGQHRIYALRKNGHGERTLLCEVVENLSDDEMALAFLKRNDGKRVDQFTRFHVAQTAELHIEIEVQNILTDLGLKTKQGKKRNRPNTLGCVGTLIKVFQKTGPEVLRFTLETLRDAFEGDSEAFDATLIQATSKVLARYANVLNARDLAAALATKRTVYAVFSRADTLRKGRMTKTDSMAKALVAFYNENTRGKPKLKEW
jgi:hypothetical protein